MFGKPLKVTHLLSMLLHRQSHRHNGTRIPSYASSDKTKEGGGWQSAVRAMAGGSSRGDYKRELVSIHEYFQGKYLCVVGSTNEILDALTYAP